jgi:Xaa-Pro aminopeptidase
METRLARARACLSDGLDALLFVSKPNIFWLTGFTGNDAALVVTRDHIRLFVDSRYTLQAELETSYDVQEIKQKWEEVCFFLIESKISKIGFESNILDFDMAARLKDIFSGTELVPAGSMLRELRIIKDRNEVGKIIQAAKISENVMESILEKGIRGRTEKDVAIEIEYEMRRLGADGPSFETIVASGQRSAMPHASPTDKVIAKKEAVVFDFGCIFEGYCSDQTVTVYTGEPDHEFKEVYSKVWEAQQRVIAGIVPEKKASEIDALARVYLEENWLKDCYGHGTGHGVGIEVHEPPTISPRSADIIKQGMVITIEPAAYFAGRFGIRIEDCLFVTDSSCKHLTNIAKGAIIIAD